MCFKIQPLLIMALYHQTKQFAPIIDIEYWHSNLVSMKIDDQFSTSERIFIYYLILAHFLLLYFYFLSAIITCISKPTRNVVICFSENLEIIWLKQKSCMRIMLFKFQACIFSSSPPPWGEGNKRG